LKGLETKTDEWPLVEAAQEDPAHFAELYEPKRNDDDQILPTLFGSGYGNYPVHGKNFAFSGAIHLALVALVASTGIWVSKHAEQAHRIGQMLVTDISPYVLPASRTQSGGGGGGGGRDKLTESKGRLPRASNQQITPPAVVVRNENPKLTAEPTVVAPPTLRTPDMPQIGNPLSAVLGPPSNGPGFGGGIGSGSGGGVGSGTGPGVGPGSGGGVGGGVYRVGGGVSAPRVIYDPDPEYSEEARRAKYQGVVVLWMIVGVDGHPRDIRVSRTLGMGLDEKAIDAVRKWKFEPALKDGHPVAVQVNVEVTFRLY